MGAVVGMLSSYLSEIQVGVVILPSLTHWVITNLDVLNNGESELSSP